MQLGAGQSCLEGNPVTCLPSGSLLSTSPPSNRLWWEANPNERALSHRLLRIFWFTSAPEGWTGRSSPPLGANRDVNSGIWRSPREVPQVIPTEGRLQDIARSSTFPLRGVLSGKAIAGFGPFKPRSVSNVREGGELDRCNNCPQT